VNHWYNWVPVAVILLYRVTLSPILGRFCRFTPTCSRYGEDCFRRFGFWKALALTLWRIVRCNPFCSAGHDPVPDPDDPRPFRRCRGQ
jgi:putative membrane protein insertion efficiency factor